MDLRNQYSPQPNIDLPISTFIPLDVDNFGKVWFLLFFNFLSLKKTHKKNLYVCLYVSRG